jgi:hypothetical protein
VREPVGAGYANNKIEWRFALIFSPAGLAFSSKHRGFISTKFKLVNYAFWCARTSVCERVGSFPLRSIRYTQADESKDHGVMA